MGLYAFPCDRASKLNQQICISPAPGRSSKLTHTGVEIDTCAFQTGCQLFSAATGMSLELRFWRDFSGVKRTCWTTGSWRSCLSLEVVSSIPAGSTIIYRFLCWFICISLYQSIKIKPTNMYIASARAQLKKLTHTRFEIDTCAFQTGCQLSSAASGMSLELRFWRGFNGGKRTCWTTGSWRSCLSLEVVSSIPAGSTIIHRFLCGFICVSLCQSIKIKPTNMYIASARAQLKKLTHTGVEIDTCAFQTGCQLFSAATGMSLELRFWRDFSGVKRTCWTTGSWRSCLSLEVVSSIPAGSTIIYRFLCGFICVSLCQSIKIKPTNMYIASARAQFTCAFQTGCQLFSATKKLTHRCWNWHLCIPDGLSVVQCNHGHVIGVAFLARFQWREAYVLDNWQLAELPQSGGREFDPRRVHDNLSVPLWVYMRFPVPEHQNQTNKYVYRQRQGAVQKINTHRCWNWHLCIPDGLSVVQCSHGHVIGVAFLARFQWREAYVLDNWQLAELPQSGGREFDPRRVHDNLSVPLWVYMRFPVPEHQNQTNKYVYRQRQGAVQKINTHRCWNWHLCIPDGLSVVQCSHGHVIGVAFLARFQWREAYVLDNWQLAELPQSGGREFDPRRVHDNLSVPLWVYMRFSVPEHQNQTNKYVYCQRQGAVQKINTQVLKLTPVHSRRVVSCSVQPRACHWSWSPPSPRYSPAPGRSSKN